MIDIEIVKAKIIEGLKLEDIIIKKEFGVKVANMAEVKTIFA